MRSGQFFDALGDSACRLGVDGEPSFSARIDGLLTIRHLLNILGVALLRGIAEFPSKPTRTTHILSANFIDCRRSGGVNKKLAQAQSHRLGSSDTQCAHTNIFLADVAIWTIFASLPAWVRFFP